MKWTSYYTISKSKSRYDIVEVNLKEKSYCLYLGCNDFDACLTGGKPVYLCREEFDKVLSAYKQSEVLDLSKYNPEDYTRFYRESIYDCYTVDMIEINSVTKEYTLRFDISDSNTDGCDVLGNEIYSTYVGDLIFDAIVEGIKISGFKEVSEFNDIS